LLPPLGCGYLKGASKLTHSKAPFGRTIERGLRARSCAAPLLF